LQQKGKVYSVLVVGLRTVLRDFCTYSKVKAGVQRSAALLQMEELA